MQPPAASTGRPPRPAAPAPRRLGTLLSLLVHTAAGAAAIGITVRVMPAEAAAYAAAGGVAPAAPGTETEPPADPTPLPPMPAAVQPLVPLPHDPPPPDDSIETAPDDAPELEPATDAETRDWAAILASYRHRRAPATAAAPAAAPPSAGPATVTPPQAIYQPAPARPRSVRHRRGTVLLRLQVGADGTPVQVVVHRSSGVSPLDQAARTAAQTWRFRPATRDGRPVATWVEIPVRF